MPYFQSETLDNFYKNSPKETLLARVQFVDKGSAIGNICAS
jgi:hypothetical protein